MCKLTIQLLRKRLKGSPCLNWYEFLITVWLIWDQTGVYKSCSDLHWIVSIQECCLYRRDHEVSCCCSGLCGSRRGNCQVRKLPLCFFIPALKHMTLRSTSKLTENKIYGNSKFLVFLLHPCPGSLCGSTSLCARPWERKGSSSLTRIQLSNTSPMS